MSYRFSEIYITCNKLVCVRDQFSEINVLNDWSKIKIGESIMKTQHRLKQIK